MQRRGGRTAQLRQGGKEPESWHGVYGDTCFRFNQRVEKPGVAQEEGVWALLFAHFPVGFDPFQNLDAHLPPPAPRWDFRLSAALGQATEHSRGCYSAKMAVSGAPSKLGTVRLRSLAIVGATLRLETTPRRVPGFMPAPQATKVA